VPITKNPYGVGESGQDKVNVTRRCRCCGLGFLYQTRRLQQEIRLWCPDCVDHHQQPDEPESRELARLRTHEPALRARVEQATSAADRMESEVANRRAATASALRRRDEVERILMTVLQLHAPSGERCGCGERYPCKTISTMRAVHPREMRWLEEDAERATMSEHHIGQATAALDDADADVP
jgi:hypothetical protein